MQIGAFSRFLVALSVRLLVAKTLSTHPGHLQELVVLRDQHQDTFGSTLSSEGNRGAIEIKALNIPERLENGTKESIILDCVYSFDEKKDKMLVVKWFLNDDTTPIYQWIVELGTRSVIQRLMGRIDANYSIPNASKYTRHRAIKLLHPTTDLSGKYKCNVQSIRGEQNKAKTMIIYAPPKNVSFTFERLSHQSRSPKPKQTGSATNREMMALQTLRDASAAGAILKCNVENVYPKPDLRLYGVRRDGSRYLLPDTTRQEKSYPQSRAHSIYLSAQVYDAEVLRKYNEDGFAVHDDQEDAHLFQQHPYHYNQERQEVRAARKPGSSRQSFDFECVSSVDVRGSTNLTKAVALTYTPSTETKNFFRSSATRLSPSLTSGFLLLTLRLISTAFSG